MNWSRYIIGLFLTLFVYSCVNSPDNLSQKKDSKDVLNISHLFPDDLMISSTSHDLLLNSDLFKNLNLEKGSSCSLIDSLIDESLRLDADFHIDRTDLRHLRSVRADVPVEIKLSFICKKCKDAYIIRSEANDWQMNQAIKEGLLSIEGSKEWRISTTEQGFYSDSKVIRPNKSGWRSIYLVLRDSANITRIFEMASFLADNSAPQFFTSDILCPSFQGNKDFEGLVCLEAKEFEGNSYDGYNVPFKGRVYGDVESLRIDGRLVKLKGENFYQRLNLRLHFGYNQVPIVITDSIGNKNETYMEINLERIHREPYVENNIYN